MIGSMDILIFFLCVSKIKFGFTNSITVGCFMQKSDDRTGAPAINVEILNVNFCSFGTFIKRGVDYSCNK